MKNSPLRKIGIIASVALFTTFASCVKSTHYFKDSIEVLDSLDITIAPTAAGDFATIASDSVVLNLASLQMLRGQETYGGSLKLTKVKSSNFYIKLLDTTQGRTLNCFSSFTGSIWSYKTQSDFNFYAIDSSSVNSRRFPIDGTTALDSLINQDNLNRTDFQFKLKARRTVPVSRSLPCRIYFNGIIEFEGITEDRTPMI